MIIVDSREKKNAHILRYFEKNGIDYIIRKMDVADYQIEGADKLVIDRKQNLEELAGNLTNPQDKGRFWREIRRAHRSGQKIIILCEHGKGIKTIPDVANWSSRYSPVSGRNLQEKIYQCHISYGVEFLFCEKSETGAKIIELLGGV